MCLQQSRWSMFIASPVAYSCWSKEGGKNFQSLNVVSVSCMSAESDAKTVIDHTLVLVVACNLQQLRFSDAFCRAFDPSCNAYAAKTTRDESIASRNHLVRRSVSLIHLSMDVELSCAQSDGLEESARSRDALDAQKCARPPWRPSADQQMSLTIGAHLLRVDRPRSGPVVGAVAGSGTKATPFFWKFSSPSSPMIGSEILLACLAVCK